MDKNTIFVGIDISKDTVNVYDVTDGHFQFKNDAKGFSLFLKRLSADHWCVMEATGRYHHCLAAYLYERGIRLSVVNPLVIKRFVQMKLKHVKTDRSDAKMICGYAREQALKLRSPEAPYIVERKRFQSAIRLYFERRTALKNMLHSLSASGQGH